MSSPFVHLEIQNHIAELTLDRPQRRNAIASHEDCQELLAGIARLNEDQRLRCAIVSGRGEAFCSGGDLRAMASGTGIGRRATALDTCENYRHGVQSMIRALWSCEIPLIAAVNGPAIGLGCDLAACCDLRIAADSARFASSFINVGLIPGDGGAWILPRIIGLARASELILTGQTIDARQALDWGLVSRVVPDAELRDSATQLARVLAAQPARSLRLAKRLLREGQQQRLSDLLELSAAYQAFAHETEDHAEALAAFAAKRKPRFTGQ